MEFSSPNYQSGHAFSRRDDMVSLLYLIEYLIKGKLPWSEEFNAIKKIDHEKCKSLIEAKESHEDNLFEGHAELKRLFKYSLELNFEEKPQYSYYTSIFNRILEKSGEIDDKIYDWMFLDE